MAYLEEFRNQLNARNYTKVLQLWQEYCAGDIADREEIEEILQLIKTSEFAKHFGSYVEAILPLVNLIEKEEDRHECYRLIFDLQTTNSQPLQELITEHFKKHFSHLPLYNEKLRLIGLRNGESFQGAISNFILLNHLQKGNFVLHAAGWGVGEIIEVSFLREQSTIEFEYLHGGKKELAFKNSFKTLLPIPKTHFLARRFAEPDLLEKEAKEDPLAVMHALLRDLGPKTAAEIKDELSDLVIPEQEYSKWWQQTRARLKKDSLIEVPENTKEPFRLRKGHASWEERVEKAFIGKHSCEAVLSSAYSLIRDFPELLKNEMAKARLIEKIQGLFLRKTVTAAEHLQLLLFLENPLGVQPDENALKNFVCNSKTLNEILQEIEIIALKKRLLAAIHQHRSDWSELFLDLVFTIEPNQLRDLLLKDLNTPLHGQELKQRIEELIRHPKKHPEGFFWYFQKILHGEAPYFNDAKDKYTAIEALFILLSHLDNKPEYRELSKKIYTLLTGERFQVIRDFLKESSKEFAEEFLLLASKCGCFSEHDRKILQSLVEVVHKSLIKAKKPEEVLEIIWTTQEGLQRIQERIQQIGTVEIVDVAKEIEVARSHGDLRENSEYKFALERRSRLQNELKALSDQFHKARVITKDDISITTVGIGTNVTVKTPQGELLSYVILGPLDADPDKSILSFQSKLAQAMDGKKRGEKFRFKDDEFTITAITSYLEE